MKSEVTAQSNTVGRLRFFFGGGDAREHPGGLLRVDPAFAYAEMLESLKPASSPEGLYIQLVQVYRVSKIKGLRIPTGSDEIEFLDPEAWETELE